VNLKEQHIPLGVVRTLFALGHTRFEQGDLHSAETCYREGLVLLRETPLVLLIAAGLEELAGLAAANKQPVRAARLWGAAEALLEMTDGHRWPEFQQTNTAMLAAAQAQLTAAN
jgi:hypothetical protein